MPKKKPHGFPFAGRGRDTENKTGNGNKHRNEVGELTKGRCVKARSREPWSPKGEQRRDAKVGNRLCFRMATQQENNQSLLLSMVE